MIQLQLFKVLNRLGEGSHATQMAEMMAKFYDLYEPAGDDEKNAYNISINEDMTVEDVLQEALKIVENVQ